MQNIKKMNAQEKVQYMQTEDVRKLIGRLSVPTIISMLVTTLYNLADTFFVGKLDTQSTAAVGIVFSVMGVIQALGFFFGHGSGNYISRKLGAGEFEEASIMASTGFFYCFGTGVLLAAIASFFVQPLAVVLGSTETILPYTIKYLRIILIGAPFSMTGFVLNNQLRFQGSASYAMIGICTGAVLNIGLDPLFIFALDMKISGAALSTVISQAVSFTVLFIMTKRGNNISIHIKNVRFRWHYFWEIFKGGIPSLLRQGLGSISTTLLNRAAGAFSGDFSDAAIAAMSIINRVCFFCNAALIGLGQGFQPVCGMNYGGKKYARVREAFWFCLKISALVLLVFSIIGFVFAEQIVTTFRKEDADVIRVGTLALRCQMAVFPLSSIVVLTNMMLQSVGKAGRASLMASARQGLFLIPIVEIIPRFMGLLGVQTAQMFADICSAILAVPLLISFINEMKKAERALLDDKQEGISS